MSKKVEYKAFLETLHKQRESFFEEIKNLSGVYTGGLQSLFVHDKFRQLNSLKSADDVYYKIPLKNKKEILGVFYFTERNEFAVVYANVKNVEGAVIFGEFDEKNKKFKNVGLLNLKYDEAVLRGMSSSHPVIVNKFLSLGNPKSLFFQFLFENFHFKDGKFSTDEIEIFNSIYDAQFRLENPKNITTTRIEKGETYQSLKFFDLKSKKLLKEFIVFNNGINVKNYQANGFIIIKANDYNDGYIFRFYKSPFKRLGKNSTNKAANMNIFHALKDIVKTYSIESTLIPFLYESIFKDVQKSYAYINTATKEIRVVCV